MTANPRNVPFVRRASLVSALCCSLLTTALVSAEPKVNGRLEEIGPYRVLRVWGTPEEMGFAHGYLIGSEYLTMVNEDQSRFAMEQRRARDMVWAGMLPLVSLPENARIEIEAIYTGIVQRHGGKPRIESLERTLEVQDLILHNAGDLLRAFACSGFTVWGERAGGARLITGRNFDYDPVGPESVKSQFILVREPTGKRKVATVTFPGYIGAFTGINEDGVCTFMHDGGGPGSNRRVGTFTPVALVLKDILENNNGESALRGAEASLRSVVPYPFSYLIRTVTPNVDDPATRPARIFRIDMSGLTENPTGGVSCITTNHYLRNEDVPAANAGNDSRQRYAVLDAHVSVGLDGERAWNALAAVTAASPRSVTLQTLVVFPVERRLDISLATWTDKVIPAANIPPTSIRFQELFNRTD